MSNPLLARLRENDKKGFFDKTQTSVSYPTLFTPFDFRNGYMVEVKDLQNNVLDEYPSLGFLGGSFVTIIGKPGTAKTTFAIQAAANIVRPFNSGFVQHYDLERATTYTRIRNVTNFNQSELDNKYILKQEACYIEDIHDAVVAIAKAKEENRKTMMYDTGLKDEFNKPIIAFEPTVILTDSIPVMASRDSGDEMEGSTYANRVAKALSQFYNRLIPIIKAYNIMIIAINHIKQKIDINPRMRTAPQVNYLKPDETIPGGWAAIYYANTLVKFTATGGKFDIEEDGFNGFNVRVDFIKSRTNQAGQFCNLIYTQNGGFDNILTQYAFAEEHGLVQGRNPYRYFGEHKDHKFDSRKLLKEIANNKELNYLLFDTTVPILEKQLSRVDDESKLSKIANADLIQRLAESGLFVSADEAV